MNNQSQYINIKNRELYRRSYFLRKEYKELIYEVHQAGGSMWAEFIVEFTPSDNHDIAIELVDAAPEHGRLHTCYSMGVSEGIKKFKSQINNQGIGILGMNIKITNLSYHLVDSKSSGYTYPLLYLLNRLRNTEFFGLQVNAQRLPTAIQSSKVIGYDIHKEQYILKESQFQLVSPKRFPNTLVLGKRIETTIKDLEKGIGRWKITISPKSEYDRRQYTIDVEFRDRFESVRKYKTVSYSLQLYQQIQHVLNEFQIRKINISGFYVLIEPLYNNEQEPFVKSNIELIKWAIFQSLLDKDITKIKKEKL